MGKRFCAIFLCLMLFQWRAYGEELTTWQYEASDEALNNPLTGNAVWADSDAVHPQQFSLVYANITWKELEPEEGHYAFETLEEKYRFAQWKNLGKHLILRFVMDIPGDAPHCDLPEWLAGRIAGTSYVISYGRGWSPDYHAPELMAAHRKALKALGDRYDSDPFVAFVELGSLGHWGEWHVHESLGTLPDEATRNQYIQDYLDAFHETHLMMRRPFRSASENGMGLFNDAVGDNRATLLWLDWIENGGEYQGEADALSPMPDSWKTCPIGGELSTSKKVSKYLNDDQNLLHLLRLSHASWVGPNSFSEIKEEKLQASLDHLLNSIGYRLRVTRCSLEQDLLTVEIRNDGIAPFYYPWPVQVRMTDFDGNNTILESELDLREILPGVSVQTAVRLDACESWKTIALGIINPVTNTPSVRFAMNAVESDGWTVLADRSD